MSALLCQGRAPSLALQTVTRHGDAKNKTFISPQAGKQNMNTA